MSKLCYVNGKLMKENTKNPNDQYFTKPEVAKYLYEKAKEIIQNYEGSLQDYLWIEPAVGDGSFYDLFPEDRRIGIDIEPRRKEFIESDYLEYQLPEGKKIVLGNPPFGHRGVLALEFINHSSTAHYVCFILPMFFESKGKGSARYRVKDLNLIYSERLPKDSFYFPNTNKKVNIICVFQIWSKEHKIETDDYSWYRGEEPFKDIIELYTVSTAKNRECGRKWITDKADFYISSTFYGNAGLLDDFSKVKYGSGVAGVFKTEDEAEKNRIIDGLKSIDWTEYATPSTNNCYHIGKSQIYEAIRRIRDNV